MEEVGVIKKRKKGKKLTQIEKQRNENLEPN